MSLSFGGVVIFVVDTIMVVIVVDVAVVVIFVADVVIDFVVVLTDVKTGGPHFH